MMCSHPNWQALATVSYPYKRFIRESRTSYENDISAVVSHSIASGDKLKADYEEILALPLEKPREQDLVTKVDFQNVSVTKKSQERRNLNERQKVNALMKEASLNNVEGITNLLGNERELNVADQFGWTMLMCAAHAGATDVVKYLLENGADTEVKDRSGYTCVSLAKRQKHLEILNLFKSLPVPERKTSERNNEIKSVFCDVCKQHFEDTATTLHKNSTVHLFNIHPRKDTTWYGIPDSNKGFKLMIKNGWNREQGLGPGGSGTKFPPKTVLKRDRKGLGIKSGVARVTHFKPHDTFAVAMKNRESNHRRQQKISIKSRISSERRKERLLRRELNF